MSSILWRYSRRSLTRHPWLTLLSVAGIALGIAVVVSIDLANQSATRAFELSTEAVTGRATHALVSGPSGISEDVYSRLRGEMGLDAAAPIVEGYARLASAPERTFQVLGVDFLAEAPFRPALGGPRVDLRALLTQPGAILLSQTATTSVGLRPGDSLEVRVEGANHRLTLAGTLSPTGSAVERAMENLLVTDISTAQELLGKVGRLDRIDLLISKSDPTLSKRIESALPPGVQLVRASSRAQALEQLTRAFRLNLTALSLLALLVGMFLIYNTMTFSVVQRREVLGVLRALGVTRRQIFSFILAETLLLATAGTALGMVGGVALGRGLMRLVTRTINDLYFVVSVRQLALEPATLIKGAFLGLGATTLAALWPALQATRVPPSMVLQRSGIESRIGSRLPAFSAAGLLVLLAAATLFSIPSRDPRLAFSGLAFVLLGFSLIAPLLTLALATAARPVLGATLGVLGRMAARGVVTSLSRTSVAITALMVAVATTVAVGVMVSSFRGTVSRWLETSLIADVYVSAPGLVSRRGEATLPPELVERIRRAPGVGQSTSVRTARVRWKEQSIDLIATDLSQIAQRPYRFKQGRPAEIWPQLESTDAVVVSEPFAFHHLVEVGDSLLLATDLGERGYRILGIYYDYGSDSGTVMMSRAAYERSFRDRGFTGLGLFTAAGVPAQTLIDQIRNLAGPGQQLLIRSNRDLREISLQIFDRTFAITQVLRALSVSVAFIGVLTALMALQLERARELAVLRAIGLLPRELWKVVTYQTGLMGALAGLMSLPLGALLAYILVHAINKRSFGWTLQLSLAPELLGQALLLAFGAAVLAGLYPAWRMARTNPADALREG